MRFFTATRLINDLVEAQEQHSLGRRLAQLQKLDLLILDEVGFVPFTSDGARLLFHRCLVLEFNGDSYRFRESLKRQGTKN